MTKPWIFLYKFKNIHIIGNSNILEKKDKRKGK